MSLPIRAGGRERARAGAGASAGRQRQNEPLAGMPHAPDPVLGTEGVAAAGEARYPVIE